MYNKALSKIFFLVLELSFWRLVDKNLLYFLNLVDKPIISTSANLSGESTCKNIEEISAVFNGTIFGAFDGQLGGEKKPSKILDLENNE